MRSQAFSSMVALLAIAAMASSAHAARTFSLNMTGAQEVLPVVGDPDGSATGFITFNEATDALPLLVSWNFSYLNLALPLSAMHIHTGAAGVAGAVHIGLGVGTSGGAGTLISSLTTDEAKRDAVLANPSGFYVNIHTPGFAQGAVRGQLIAVSEPGALALLGLAALICFRMRRV